jgi:hypothetical protein
VAGPGLLRGGCWYAVATVTVTGSGAATPSPHCMLLPVTARWGVGDRNTYGFGWDGIPATGVPGAEAV